jgi:hypothetical protein
MMPTFIKTLAVEEFLTALEKEEMHKQTKSGRFETYFSNSSWKNSGAEEVVSRNL